MADPFLGEIRMFAGNFAPKGWALCDGQLLTVNEKNNALFSLLEIAYGGDGRTTFGLPDLRGRLPVHVGQVQLSGQWWLSTRYMGQRIGSERVTLNTNEIPHNHPFMASSENASDDTISENVFGKVPTNDSFYAPASDNPTEQVNLISGTIQSTGGSQAHNNVMPFLCINFIIALVGIYPSRS